MKTLTPTETAAFQSMLNRLAGAGLNQDGIWGGATQSAFEKWAGISHSKPEPVADDPEDDEFDERSERNLATLLPGVRNTVRAFLRVARARGADFGCDVRIISGTRSYAEQDALYAKGRTAPGPEVTKARGGYSNHNFGIAVDLGIFKNGEYLDSANPALALRVHNAIAETVKGKMATMEWGGDWDSFKDIPHWEYKTGLTTAQKRERVAAGQSII